MLFAANHDLLFQVRTCSVIDVSRRAAKLAPSKSEIFLTRLCSDNKFHIAIAIGLFAVGP